MAISLLFKHNIKPALLDLLRKMELDKLLEKNGKRREIKPARKKWYTPSPALPGSLVVELCGYNCPATKRKKESGD